MLNDDRDPVDVLAEEFADRMRRGEFPSVSDYAAAHPDHAQELRDLLPAVAQMELLKRNKHAVTKPIPDRLGDYRIVREIGRGGMGVVFEAVQESLGRSVALKILARHAQLDAKRRTRFLREAQAAAKLHHTNIVPVFGVGEHDGLPYYAMQLIPGVGLHALVHNWRKKAGRAAGHAPSKSVARQVPTVSGSRPVPLSEPAAETKTGSSVEIDLNGPKYGDWAFVARAGAQAAEALHYAHKHGVLHRDVKPGNLIHDGEIVWVTDFGLAKLSESDGLTATGDILGTLQYLAPECLTGDADPRSDVYGLGATLYELLTLDPPYPADSPGKLIKMIADTDPPAPRALNPDVPRDLETIVLRAMNREPRLRYASAREFAADLTAFLEDRPIKARRTSTAARAWRWCRRNPAVAALAASTLAALSLAAVAGWVGYARTTDALEREAARRRDAEVAQRAEEAAHRDADRARGEAQQTAAKLEANLKLSLETFESVFDAAAGSARPAFGIPIPALRGHGHGRGGHGGPPGGAPPAPPTGAPGGPSELAASNAAVLEAVLAFYDKFAEQNAPTQRLQMEAAKASRRVCEAHVWLKRPDKAVAAFRRAVTLLEPLHAAAPNDPDVRDELVTTYANAPGGAFADRDAPLRRVAELTANDPWQRGSAQFSIGLVRQQENDEAGALEAFRTAVAMLEAVRPLPQQAHTELAAARLWFAALLSKRGQHKEARKELEESVADLRPVAGPPGPPNQNRELLGVSYFALGEVCRQLKDGAAAERAFRDAAQYAVVGFFGGPGGGRPGGPFGGFPGGLPWVGGKKDGPPGKGKN
jgi:serine/threonine protein kinase